MTDPLKESFRGLLLPVHPQAEESAVEVVASALSSAGYDAADHAEVLALETARWREGHAPSPLFRAIIRGALEAGDSTHGRSLAAKYLPTHERLRLRRGLTFEQASAFLSHALLAAHLAANEALSSAQIAKLLASRDQRADFHWRAVEVLLRSLGLKPSLARERVDELIERDRALEETAFADAGVVDAAALVGRTASRLGFSRDLEHLLLQLVSPDLDTHTAYLRALFYQCVIAEFYDHAMTTLYEFAPRGDVAKHVFQDVLTDLPGAWNAFLNNVKGTDPITLDWARARKGNERPRAEAVVEILVALEEMGFAARKELSGWLRRWVLRIGRLSRPLVRLVAQTPTPAEVAGLIEGVAVEPTRTAGIIEQRLVDAIALSRHPADDGWHAYGLGDSVNASNLGSRKFGDCEFQRSEARLIVAYEAHAGRLSDVYIDSHMEALWQVLTLRHEELERVAKLADWTIEVVFVAHVLDCEPRELEVDCVTVRVQLATFEEIAVGIQPPEVVDLFAEWVNSRLNEPRTPQPARDTYLRLIEPPPPMAISGGP